MKVKIWMLDSELNSELENFESDMSVISELNRHLPQSVQGFTQAKRESVERLTKSTSEN